MLSTVGNEVLRISAIIEHFLRYARPQELSITRVTLDALIEDVLSIVTVRASLNNIEIVTDIEHTENCTCDIDQIKQALVNILLNAIEQIGENGTVTIRGRRNRGSVELTVEDTGGGISRDIRARIFDPYFTTKDSGTGLGLSEVHRIVTAHGGRVHVANSDAGGAVFTIVLPIKEG